MPYALFSQPVRRRERTANLPSCLHLSHSEICFQELKMIHSGK
jgi:hypothetical protein